MSSLMDTLFPVIERDTTATLELRAGSVLTAEQATAIHSLAITVSVFGSALAVLEKLVPNLVLTALGGVAKHTQTLSDAARSAAAMADDIIRKATTP